MAWYGAQSTARCELAKADATTLRRAGDCAPHLPPRAGNVRDLLRTGMSARRVGRSLRGLWPRMRTINFRVGQASRLHRSGADPKEGRRDACPTLRFTASMRDPSLMLWRGERVDRALFRCCSIGYSLSPGGPERCASALRPKRLPTALDAEGVNCFKDFAFERQGVPTN